MSRKYSVGFFVGMLLLVFALCMVYQISYNHALEEQEKEQLAKEKVLQTEGIAFKENGYVITMEDGYVIVYYSDMETVYEYTSIETEYLPDDILKKLADGIYVENIQDIYGFLENYSS